METLRNDNIMNQLLIFIISDDVSSEDSMDAIFPEDPPFELRVIPPGCGVERLKWACLVPFHALFYFTIPDIRRKRMRSYFGLTFVMSIIWIGMTTYILVWMTTLIGFTFGIPDAVMGLTFIAFGSSIPDAIASILVSKQGEIDFMHIDLNIILFIMSSDQNIGRKYKETL